MFHTFARCFTSWLLRPITRALLSRFFPFRRKRSVIRDSRSPGFFQLSPSPRRAGRLRLRPRDRDYTRRKKGDKRIRAGRRRRDAGSPPTFLAAFYSFPCRHLVPAADSAHVIYTPRFRENDRREEDKNERKTRKAREREGRRAYALVQASPPVKVSLQSARVGTRTALEMDKDLEDRSCSLAARSEKLIGRSHLRCIFPHCFVDHRRSISADSDSSDVSFLTDPQDRTWSECYKE